MNPSIDAEKVARELIQLAQKRIDDHEWVMHKSQPFKNVEYAPVELKSFAQSYLTLLERNRELEEALEGLTNAALAGLKPLQSQINAGFKALSITSQGSAGEK